MRSRGCLTIAACAAVLALGAACGQPVPARAPDVLLVIVDTLRADRVGRSGDAHHTTPALDALASSATRFTRAYATAPWTQPSVASILTGVLPSRHGLTRFAALPEEIETLPERLGEAGYATTGIVSHVLLSRRFGFDQGFARFLVSSAYPVHEAISSAAVTARTEEVLRRAAAAGRGRRPFFVMAHYFDPHYVFHAHDEPAWARGPVGRLRGGEDIEALRELAPDLSEAERDFVRSLYDEEVRHTDAAIGRLLRTLEATGLAAGTLLIVTADHGEELFERGWIGHTRTLYEEVVRVPLLVRPPGGVVAGAEVVARPVSLASIAPTVLDFAGVAMTDGERAASLRPLLGGDADPAVRGAPVVIEVDFVGEGPANASKTTHAKAIVVGDEKLVRDDRTGALRLYDLAADPGERDDLANARPDRARALDAQLDATLAEARAGASRARVVAPSEAEREELRALGYVEGREARAPRR